jgi:hypothetical protein
MFELVKKSNFRAWAVDLLRSLCSCDSETTQESSSSRGQGVDINQCRLVELWLSPSNECAIALEAKEQHYDEPALGMDDSRARDDEVRRLAGAPLSAHAALQGESPAANDS